MGCVSSKLIFRKHLKGDPVDRDFTTHVVSLTSSTYGALKLDKLEQQQQQQLPIKEILVEVKKSPPRDDPEIINAWELMEGLEEEVIQVPILIETKKSPKSRPFFRGFVDIDARTPLKFLNQMGSPGKLKRFGGKENKGGGGKVNGVISSGGLGLGSPKRILKASTLPPNLRISKRGSPNDVKCDGLRVDSGMVSSRRRSLGPLFDPELVASFEKELSEEEEQIKKMVSVTPTSRKARNSRDSKSMLDLFDKKLCPPGGENGVVIYTTTLRGIRKTFEDCNIARSIIESYRVQMFERDVSMDSGFKEELRKLMGKKEVKVPLVFVKGRLIGGADEMLKLDEEGKLGILFDGIPRAMAVCQGCAGVRFVMCRECSGSCKVLAEDGKKTVKCGECNENGLIHCPICS